MKRYHILIEAGETFDQDCCLYKFSVGTSVRDQRALLEVIRYANDNGYYHGLWTVENRNFVERLARSVGCHFLQLNWVHIDVVKLAQHIRKYNVTPRKQPLTPHEIYVRKVIGCIIPM